MMVRIAAFLASDWIWRSTPYSETENLFLYLYYLEYESWLGSRRITDTIVNPKTIILGSLLAYILGDTRSQFYANFHSRDHIKKRVREEDLFSKVTYQAYQKEVKEGQLLAYIQNYLLQRREAQIGKVTSTSLRRRSSEDSVKSNNDGFHGQPITKKEVPRVRDVSSLMTLWNVSKLLPPERETKLLE